MDLNKIFKKGKKIEIKYGSYGGRYQRQMETAFKLYSKIKNLEDNVEYTIIKNKFAVCIYKKEDK